MAATPMKEVINLVNSEASRLGEFLSGLSAQDWSRHSDQGFYHHSPARWLTSPNPARSPTRTRHRFDDK